jgi:hypothetical protein
MRDDKPIIAPRRVRHPTPFTDAITYGIVYGMPIFYLTILSLVSLYDAFTGENWPLSRERKLWVAGVAIAATLWVITRLAKSIRRTAP